MDVQPEQLDLGALGFAGICRETFRELLRAILRNKGARSAAILSAFFLLQVATNLALHSLLASVDSSDLVHGAVAFPLLDSIDSSDLVHGAVAFPLLLISKIVCIILVLLPLSLVCPAAFALPYCTDGDSGACYRILQDLPPVLLDRLVRMYFLHVILLCISYTLLSIAACLVFLLLEPSNEVVILPLRVIGGAACLAGAAAAAYGSVVLHIASLVTVVEKDFPLGAMAMRKTRALLAGKFWAAATVFVPLDGCFVALEVPFLFLTHEEALGLASRAAMAVALWAVVVVTLLAEPVVYMVCKNHQHEVADKVHLNYVGRLDVYGDSGVELQPVETTRQPTATSAQASPQPAILPSTDY
ncbi:unnamed protein product [Alopecurus aequalis]